MKGSQFHRLVAVAAAGAAVMAMSACGSTSTGGVAAKQPPTAGIKPLTSVAATGEGALNLIDWGGYVQTLWQKPFEDATGCKIHYQDAGSSDEMVSLMTGGGGGNWDMVSASGDADLRLIYNGSVKPMNMDLIPDWKNFGDKFKSPPFNTINGIHYGVSLQWGPNTLLYNTDKFPTAPTTWGVLYDSQYSGLITIPDNPIQIADAALYLSVKNPSLKTTDLHLAGAHTADTIPSEGATGWADTWMMATNAPHPNCAYKWAAWISTAKVQAEQAINYGETPVNTKACAEMESLSPGSCAAFHANAPETYFNSIKFWKTPISTCNDGTENCMTYAQWQSAWTTIKG